MLTANEQAWLERRKDRKGCESCLMTILNQDDAYEMYMRSLTEYQRDDSPWARCMQCKYKQGFGKGNLDRWESPEWWTPTRKNKWPCKLKLTEAGEKAHHARHENCRKLTAHNYKDAAEFEARVAAKLAEIFDASTEIAPLCPSCPCEDDCYDGKLKCKAAILKFARLQVEDEMDT